MLLRLDTNTTVLKNVKLKIIVMEYFYNIDHVEK